MPGLFFDKHYLFVVVILCLMMDAAVILYLITFLVDKVVLGISDKKAFYVVTKNKKEVCDYIINELGHTVTIFSATGGFSKKKTPVLFTVIPTSSSIASASLPVTPLFVKSTSIK